MLAVTLSSGGYFDVLARQACRRVRRYLGLDPLVLPICLPDSLTGRTRTGRMLAAERAKFSLPDQFPGQTILYFDADWWPVARWDVARFEGTRHVHAAMDLGLLRGSLRAFDSAVAAREDAGIASAPPYVNAGMFICGPSRECGDCLRDAAGRIDRFAGVLAGQTAFNAALWSAGLLDPLGPETNWLLRGEHTHVPPEALAVHFVGPPGDKQHAVALFKR